MDINKQIKNNVATVQTVNYYKDIKKLALNSSNLERFCQILGESKGRAFVENILQASYNSKLKFCNPNSVILCGLAIATTGLSLVPALGQSCIVPYKDNAQAQIMYRGFIELANRTQKLERINVSEVREGDIEGIDPFKGEIILKKYDYDGYIERKKRAYIGNIAYIKYLSGGEYFKYMTVEEIKAHAQKYSQSYRNKMGLWVTDFEMMANKTVAKSLLNLYGPKTESMEKAIKYDFSTPTNENLTDLEYLDGTNE